MSDNLGAWPSDERRFNVVEFYHKILWASQQCEEGSIREKGGNRVTFSAEPPVIYEYEPEYSYPTNKRTSYFNYRNFRPPPPSWQQGEERNYHHHHYPQPPIIIRNKEEEEEEEDLSLFQNHRLMKTRSLSEFKPIPNGDFNATLLYPPINDDDDPPPSYIEYNVYSKPENHDLYLMDPPTPVHKKLTKKQSTVWVGQAFLQKTLRKIKSSPRLAMIGRRSSMVSLHKNKSFFSLSA